MTDTLKAVNSFLQNHVSFSGLYTYGQVETLLTEYAQQQTKELRERLKRSNSVLMDAHGFIRATAFNSSRDHTADCKCNNCSILRDIMSRYRDNLELLQEVK